VEVKSAFASGSAFAQYTDGVIRTGVVADNVEPRLNRCRAARNRELPRRSEGYEGRDRLGSSLPRRMTVQQIRIRALRVLSHHQHVKDLLRPTVDFGNIRCPMHLT